MYDLRQPSRWFRDSCLLTSRSNSEGSALLHSRTVVSPASAIKARSASDAGPVTATLGAKPQAEPLGYVATFAAIGTTTLSHLNPDGTSATIAAKELPTRHSLHHRKTLCCLGRSQRKDASSKFVSGDPAERFADRPASASFTATSGQYSSGSCSRIARADPPADASTLGGLQYCLRLQNYNIAFWLRMQ